MSYSSGHKHFAYWLNFKYSINEQDILDNPEKYLGPNYKEVLNLWFYWDSLSVEKWDVFCERYWALEGEARKNVVELAKEVIDPRFVCWLCSEILEIIAAHLYIERGIPFTFFPLIFDL